MCRHKRIIFSIFTITFLASIVSAQTLEQSLRDIFEGASNWISFIFGDITIEGAGAGEVFFIKLLIWILLFVVINLALKRIPFFGDNRMVSLIVAIVVSLIAVRYITTSTLINFIWLPYGVLGVVFSVVLPFVIGFFFIEGFDSTLIRKVGWSAYVVIFAGLAAMRWDSLSTGSLWHQNLAWLYAIIAALSFLLLLFDRQVRTALFMSSLRGVEDVNKRIEAAKISAQIEEDRTLLTQTSDSGQRRAIEKRIRDRKSTLKSILRS